MQVVYFAAVNAERDEGRWAISTLEGLLQRHEFGPTKTILALSDASTFWSRVEDGGRAVDAAKRGQAVLALVPGDSRHLEAELLERLGTALSLTDPEEAIQHLRAALQIRIERLGPDHPDVGLAYSELGVAEANADQVSESEASTRRALQIYAKGGIGGRRRAALLSNLATLLWRQAQYDEARVLMEQSLEFFESAAGPDHSDTLSVRDNLALLHLAIGEPETSAAMHLDVARGRARALGEHHYEVARSRLHAASALGFMRRNDEARAQLELALGADLEEAPIIEALALTTLAHLTLDERRDPQSARERLVAAQARVADQPSLSAHALIELGLARADLAEGQLDGALQHANEARRQGEATQGGDETQLEVDWTLAQIYAAQGRNTEATKLARSTVAAWPRDGGRNRVMRAEITHWLQAR